MLLRREGLEQEVARAARDALAGTWTPADVRGFHATDARQTPGWRAVVDMGWLDLLVGEEHGGLGMGAVAAGAVFEEAGRALLPGPLFGSVVVGALARERGLVGPATTVAFAVEHSAGGERWAGVRLADGMLSGTRALVEDADSADVVVVAAKSVQRQPVLALVERAEVATSPLDSVDRVLRCSEVRFEGAAVSGELVSGDEAHAELSRLEAYAHSLYAARMLGVAERLLEMSCEYARTREQFDRPIGGFQAVAHLLADMKVATTVGRRACYVSQVTLADDRPDAAHRARVAKGYLSRVGRRVAEIALQVHGGIGFTQEHDLHLYYKHALSLQAAWGDEREHQDALAHALLERLRARRPHP